MTVRQRYKYAASSRASDFRIDCNLHSHFVSIPFAQSNSIFKTPIRLRAQHTIEDHISSVPVVSECSAGAGLAVYGNLHVTAASDSNRQIDVTPLFVILGYGML